MASFAIRTILKEIRRQLRNAKAAERRIRAAGYTPHAAELLRSSLGGELSIPANPTAGQIRIAQRALERYRQSATATLGGVRRTDENRYRGFVRNIRDLGFQGSEEDIRILYSRLGNVDLHTLFTEMGYSSNQVFSNMAIASENGTLDDLLSHLQEEVDKHKKERMFYGVDFESYDI